MVDAPATERSLVSPTLSDPLEQALGRRQAGFKLDGLGIDHAQVLDLMKIGAQGLGDDRAQL